VAPDEADDEFAGGGGWLTMPGMQEHVALLLRQGQVRLAGWMRLMMSLQAGSKAGWVAGWGA
jgi:hypothetical protein